MTKSIVRDLVVVTGSKIKCSCLTRFTYRRIMYPGQWHLVHAHTGYGLFVKPVLAFGPVPEQWLIESGYHGMGPYRAI